MPPSTWCLKLMHWVRHALIVLNRADWKRGFSASSSRLGYKSIMMCERISPLFSVSLISGFPMWWCQVIRSRSSHTFFPMWTQLIIRWRHPNVTYESYLVSRTKEKLTKTQTQTELEVEMIEITSSSSSLSIMSVKSTSRMMFAISVGLLLITIAIVDAESVKCNKCTCVHLTANCSHANLDGFPIFLNPLLTELRIDRNRISRINSHDISVYRNLHVLDLSDNNIRQVSGESFPPKNQLKVSLTFNSRHVPHHHYPDDHYPSLSLSI